MGNFFQETLVSILKCLGLESSSSTSNFIGLYTTFEDGTTDQPPPADDQLYSPADYETVESVSAYDVQPTNEEEVESEDLGKKTNTEKPPGGSAQTNAYES